MLDDGKLHWCRLPLSRLGVEIVFGLARSLPVSQEWPHGPWRWWSPAHTGEWWAVLSAVIAECLEPVAGHNAAEGEGLHDSIFLLLSILHSSILGNMLRSGRLPSFATVCKVTSPTAGLALLVPSFAFFGPGLSGGATVGLSSTESTS